MESVALARHAMATRFEMVLYGENPRALRAAGEEAFTEIERLDRQLSFYQSSSEISRINAQAAKRPVKIEPLLFRLLSRALDLHRISEGAFDPTIAPLMRCWGFTSRQARIPTPEELDQALQHTGMRLLELDPDKFTIRFLSPDVLLDLGGIGKGYALDCAVEILAEAGVDSALLHGGSSTVLAIGAPPDAPAWKIGIAPPGAAPTELEAPPEAAQRFLAVAQLAGSAFSVSAPHGKFFQKEDQSYGHVIDPSTGQPVQRALLAACILPSGTETDALSTALLVLGAPGLELLAARKPEIKALVVEPSPSGQFKVHSRGINAVD